MASTPEKIVAMETLLEKQKLAVKQLKNFERNFKKDSPTQKTREYLRKKISELEFWWKDFNERNSKLEVYSSEDQPYFGEKTFMNALHRYTEHMNKLRELMNAQESSSKVNENTSESEKSDSDSDSESVIESGNESELNDLIGQQTANETKTKMTFSKLQASDVKNVLKTVKKIDNESSIGYAHAQLEILKTSWNDFRVTLYEIRGAGIAIDGVINYVKLQEEFASHLPNTVALD